MNPSLIEEITSRGYWRINFRPLDPAALGSLSLQRCQQVVRDAEVQLRGWYYPHVPTREDEGSGIRLLGNYVEAWTDWMAHREFWRMYESSQFLHYRAVQEDWRERDAWFGQDPNRHGEPITGPVLGVINNLWLFVEVFEFLSRLHQQSSLYEAGANVTLELHRGGLGTARTLWIDQAGRLAFLPAKSNGADVLRVGRSYSPAEIAEPKDRALETAEAIFGKFGWTPSADQLIKDIDSLYQL